MKNRTRRFTLPGPLAAMLFLCVGPVWGQRFLLPPSQPPLPPGMKEYTSPYYRVFTDIDPETAREAVLRMTHMAETYHQRTAAFSGVISTKLPFYLFNTPEEYYAAGGMAGSGGVFDGRSLMAAAVKSRDGRIARPTWHIIQHEGFHQFVHAVIRGDIPTWADEGLAEYFGEGIYAGDGFVTGVVPPYRLVRIKAEIKQHQFKPFSQIMLMDRGTWNKDVSDNHDSAEANYDQAWSMIQYLAHGDNGKYQKPLGDFMIDIGNGVAWEKAWLNNLGPADGFEAHWHDYWLAQPENPTANLYARAAVEILTSFVGRAFSQKQTFANLDELMHTDPKAMKAADDDWLPPALFADAVATVKKLTLDGNAFTLVLSTPQNRLPQIACTLPDGSKLIGQFGLRNGRFADVKVVEVAAPKAAGKAGAK
jgi:hypothetical protein